jgi:DNA-binding HxlR family transcriptional regulator
MSTRTYGQFCGLARAVEMIGERWALLIVRDLLVGPRRYTDLRHGLPRIPTNILSARLKELEGAGVVHRRVLPRPDGSVVYELTDYGRDLQDAVLLLSRWGARSLGEPRPDEIVTTDSMTMALRSTFRPEATTGPDLAFELRVGDIVLGIRVTSATLDITPGSLPDPDLVIETGPAISALMAGDISPSEAITIGAVHLTGNPDLLTRFVTIFHI